MKKILIIATVGLILLSCKKEPDHPPVKELTDNEIITLDSLLEMYQGTPITFDADAHVFATVTMDEMDGNIYKQIYIQAGKSAINVRLTSSGNLFVGDSIRIGLNGTVLSKYAGVMQLDQVDFTKNVAVQATGKYIEPEIITIEELDTSFLNLLASEPSNPNIQWPYLSRLVKLENVQFSVADTGSTYADGPNQQSKNVTLEDCNGNSIIVRTSGYANFANEKVAKGNGSLVAIVSRYNSDLQLLIRSYDEINMNGERCFGAIFKDFEDNSVTSGGWQTVMVSGAVDWTTQTFSNNTFAKITNWDGTSNSACETWLISPQIELTNSSSAKISFMNDVNYSGPALQLMVSADYDGSNPSTASWTDISSSVSWDPVTNGWGFHPSGDVDLSQFIGQVVYIGFKYTGTNTSGSTWEIDDILISG